MIFPLILIDSLLIVSYVESDVPSAFLSAYASGSRTEAGSSPVITSLELRSTIFSSSSTFRPRSISELSISPDI